MPHVIVKMYAGKSDEVKRRLADSIARALMAEASSSEASISVSIEDVQPSDWVEQVYKPEIMGRPEILIRKPGYDPLK